MTLVERLTRGQKFLEGLIVSQWPFVGLDFSRAAEVRAFGLGRRNPTTINPVDIVANPILCLRHRDGVTWEVNEQTLAGFDFQELDHFLDLTPAEPSPSSHDSSETYSDIHPNNETPEDFSAVLPNINLLDNSNDLLDRVLLRSPILGPSIDDDRDLRPNRNVKPLQETTIETALQQPSTLGTRLGPAPERPIDRIPDRPSRAIPPAATPFACSKCSDRFVEQRQLK
ncbi:hypothetical protein BCR34DRAFT_590666 [Clohesyomyces aquaticus]|uniref:C2H2-type domain-containing protein n=1 Tax=Clohesyomyces aquaticus TaxID=1231657 RepID=A0A1Y1Z7H9_9PLEO|nr:hypothetical protein BCR34DRAFT_590666 [Clohesyomyces aquaticus]